MSLKRSTRRLTGKATIAVLVTTAALVVVPAVASSANSITHGCDVKASSITAVKKSGAAGYLATGTGTWNCDGNTESVKETVYHNQGLFPDSDIADNTWSLKKSSSNQSKSVGRCDNSTVADYHADAETPVHGWLLHSADKNITTCSGTGN